MKTEPSVKRETSNAKSSVLGHLVQIVVDAAFVSEKYDFIPLCRSIYPAGSPWHGSTSIRNQVYNLNR